MISDIELGVATMFRDATQQNIILELRKPEDWAQFNKLRDMAAERERNAVERFERDKPQLIAEARKEIIERAGAKTFEHPTPFGTDRFSKSEIDRQARHSVEMDHQAEILRLRTDEAESYAELKHDICERENVRDLARDAFARATDRRSGADRRMAGPQR